MDREQWVIITAAVDRVIRRMERPGRRPRYSDRLIVLMYIWCAWQNKCLSWACDRLHYNTLFRPRQLPSISQFTRRVKSDVCHYILQKVHDDLQGGSVCLPLSFIDAMPLTVSPVSKDPEAKRGHITGGFAKGYKLHAIVNENGRIVIWCVCPLNIDEKTVAAELFTRADTAGLGELSLGDTAYDAAPLYKINTARNHTLLAPVRGQKFVSAQGRTEKKLRAMGPARREAVNIWEHHEPLANFIMEERKQIEGVFSVLNVVLGVGRLPAFIRRLSRVIRWIGTKVILYHARLLARESLAKTTAA
jgi:hypothetical protein